MFLHHLLQLKQFYLFKLQLCMLALHCSYYYQTIYHNFVNLRDLNLYQKHIY